MTFRFLGKRYRLTKRAEELMDNILVSSFFAIGLAVVWFGVLFGF